MKARTSVAIVALLALESCGSTSLGGTYAASGTGHYRLVGRGDTVSITVPEDTFVVKVNHRDYRHFEYALAIRGCNLSAEGDATTASVRSDQTCTFDIPSLGPVTVKVVGGVSREPGSPSARGDGAHVSLSGTGRDGTLESFGYSIHGKLVSSAGDRLR